MKSHVYNAFVLTIINTIDMYLIMESTDVLYYPLGMFLMDSIVHLYYVVTLFNFRYKHVYPVLKGMIDAHGTWVENMQVM